MPQNFSSSFVCAPRWRRLKISAPAGCCCPGGNQTLQQQCPHRWSKGCVWVVEAETDGRTPAWGRAMSIFCILRYAKTIWQGFKNRYKIFLKITQQRKRNAPNSRGSEFSEFPALGQVQFLLPILPTRVRLEQLDEPGWCSRPIPSLVFHVFFYILLLLSSCILSPSLHLY